MSGSQEAIAAFDPLPVAGGGEAGGRRRCVIVDVFTDTPFAGNQLGVFTDARGLDAELMQRLARELGFSETVFVLPARGRADARVRIFTPTHELSFAGHPVLGSAVVIGAALSCESVTLETTAGEIPVRLESSERAVWGSMEQPIPRWRPYEHAQALLDALGVARSGLPVEAYENGPVHVFVELEHERALAALRPDMAALAEFHSVGANCIAGAGRSWTTRMFAPALGVPEDPATGSAAGPLAVHLSRHGRIAFGDEIEVRQGEAVGRPSLLFARAEGAAARVQRVVVSGRAVIVARADFLVD